jgi:hypothetical protein
LEVSQIGNVGHSDTRYWLRGVIKRASIGRIGLDSNIKF